MDTVRTRTSGAGLFLCKLLMAAGFLCAASCTHGTHSVRADETDKLPPTLQEIRVTGDGDDTRIEIRGNKKLKYRLYNVASPPRGVIDFPMAEAPLVKTTVPADSSLVTRIDIVKNDTAGYPIARVIVKLARHVDFSASADPSNEKMVVLTVNKPQASRAAVSDEKKTGPARKPAFASAKKTGTRPPSVTAKTKPRTAMAVKPGNASGTAAAALSSKPAPAVSSEGSKNISDKSGGSEPANVTMTIEDVNITPYGIEFDVKGLNDDFKVFKEKNPQRLVIDIFGASLGVLSRQIAINKFGVKSIRFGTHPDKVRIVFDPARKIFPHCRIEINNSGLKVLFKKEAI